MHEPTFCVELRLMVQPDKRWMCEATKMHTKEVFQFVAYSPSLVIIQVIEFFGTRNLYSINIARDAE